MGSTATRCGTTGRLTMSASAALRSVGLRLGRSHTNAVHALYADRLTQWGASRPAACGKRLRMYPTNADVPTCAACRAAWMVRYTDSAWTGNVRKENGT